MNASMTGRLFGLDSPQPVTPLFVSTFMMMARGSLYVLTAVILISLDPSFVSEALRESSIAVNGRDAAAPTTPSPNVERNFLRFEKSFISPRRCLKLRDPTTYVCLVPFYAEMTYYPKV